MTQQAHREKELIADLADFKELRKQGIMPKSTKGAHDMAQSASTEYEIVSGQKASRMAKGKDTGGKEWARRAQDAYAASKRGETLSPI